MKKWAPFSSLVEQSGTLAKMKESRTRIKKPRISAERAERMDALLRNYHGETVTVTWFADGKIMSLSGVLGRIDPVEKILCFGKRRIAFKDLIDIEGGEEPF